VTMLELEQKQAALAKQDNGIKSLDERDKLIAVLSKVASGGKNKSSADRERPSRGDSELAEIRCSFAEQIAEVRQFAVQEVSALEHLFGNVVGSVPVALTVRSVSGFQASHTSLSCICEVLDKPGSEFQTKVVDGQPNPVWNESHELAEFGLGDTLQFRLYERNASLWDNVLGEGCRDNVLGEATLCGKDIYGGAFEGVLKLSNGMPGLELHVEIARLGLTHQNAEIRQVASRCNDAQKMVDEVLMRVDEVLRCNDAQKTELRRCSDKEPRARQTPRTPELAAYQELYDLHG